MNPMRNLEQLAAINRERQAEMREEARTAYLLRDENPKRKEGRAMLKWKLLVPACAALPIAVLIARAVSAAAFIGGGGGGSAFLAM